jgi:2-polyprenyl-6-methoxyphenol hydroxylase-like FAD-dependent oxidoreductase
MVDLVIAGGGLAGNCSAMLLAADGHSVTVLERDPAPPPASADVAPATPVQAAVRFTG